MKKTVAWEYWIDPLGRNLSDVEGPDYKDDDDFKPYNDNPEINFNKAIYTPFGMISNIKAALMTKNVEFWIMQTNFDITEDVLRAIENIDGVEIVEVYTRYRARIGFPRNGFFDISRVKEDIVATITHFDSPIMDNLILNLFPIDTATKIINQKNSVANTEVYWAIYVAPNGNTEVIYGDRQSEILSNIKKLKQLHTLVDGVVLTYLDG